MRILWRDDVGYTHLESLKSEVTGMTIVAPLYSDERSFFSDHEPGVFEVLRAGEFLGYVDADNEVTFPLRTRAMRPDTDARHNRPGVGERVR